MSQTTNDEIDLGYLLERINGVFKNLSISIYNSIQFLLRNWHIVLGILIAGIALGYFSEKNIKEAKYAKLVIRTNFNTAEYTYNALESLLIKSQSKDSVFLIKNGFRADKIELNEMEIVPIINFRDVSENFEPDNRTIESLLRNIEFKDEEALPNSFFVDYKYHEVELVLSPYANEKTITAIFNYLNNNPYIKDLAIVGKKEIEKNIVMNEFSIRQIDSTISNYNNKIFLPSSTNNVAVVDKNFSYNNVLQEKHKLQKRNIELRKDLVYADNAIVQVNNENIIKIKNPIYLKKFVIYPILFLFLFFAASWSLKKI